MPIDLVPNRNFLDNIIKYSYIN